MHFLFHFSKFVVLLISLIIRVFIVIAVLTKVIDIFETGEARRRLLSRLAISCHLVGLIALTDCVQLILAFVISVIVIIVSITILLLLHLQLFFLFLFAREDVFRNSSHESFILRHLLQCVPDVLQEKQLWVFIVDLEELAEVGVLGRLRPDSFLLEHTEEVFSLEESHREVLRLSLYILLKYDLFKEVLCR